VAAVTAELKVRFRQAANLGASAKVRARISERLAPLFRLRAEVVQGTSLVATAEGTFIDTTAVGKLPFQPQIT
jgi:acyl-CoA thioesterase FadM